MSNSTTYEEVPVEAIAIDHEPVEEADDIFADIEERPLETPLSIETRKLIEAYDKHRREKGEHGGVTLGNSRFYQLNTHWGGIDVGTHIIGGDSNLGKSSLLRCMAWDIVQSNPNVHVRFYTLDDAENYFLDSMVAQSANVAINAVHKPDAFINRPVGFYTKMDYELSVKRGHLAYEKFLDPKILERFSFVGTDTLGDASWNTIREDIIRTKQLIGPNKQLVVCVDNLHDIEIPGFTDTNDKTEAVAKEVDKAAKDLNLVIMGTVELKKNQQRRPIMDDIYGSRKWKYKARTIILLYSEVGVGKPNPRLYFQRPERPGELCSVLEVHFAKSKVSEFKGRLFYEQYTECGTMREVVGEQAHYYASQIS